MKSKFMIAALAASVATPMVAAAPAEAQYYTQPTYHDGLQQVEYHRDRYYRGHNRSYYRHCKRSSGTTGLIAGGAGGALLGSALGGGTLGTVAGGVGGALLGRHLDKRHDAAQNRRNGC